MTLGHQASGIGIRYRHQVSTSGIISIFYYSINKSLFGIAYVRLKCNWDACGWLQVETLALVV